VITYYTTKRRLLGLLHILTLSYCVAIVFRRALQQAISQPLTNYDEVCTAYCSKLRLTASYCVLRHARYSVISSSYVM
jgi:hypothetical protein